MKVTPAKITTLIAFAVLLTSWHAVAQSPLSKPATTWQDLGFNQLPKEFSTELIPLFEGLNKARGTWTFEGEVAGDDGAGPLKGSLKIGGNPKSGMVPMWQIAWSWPVDDPAHMMVFNILAGPRKEGFDLMLIRIGPVKNPQTGDAEPKVSPTPFKGTWSLENRTITWTERASPTGLRGQPAQQDAATPKQTFEMVVADDGKILIQNSQHTRPGQMTIGKAIVRTGQAPTAPVTLIGKQNFHTVAEIKDRRIQPCLPPQATEISLLSERGGHFARYKVKEADFMKFLDQLWEAKKGSSAHKREEMAGEAEPANQERMARRFQAIGWEPLDNAITYYSPSKPNGAITTYYYDREAGVAYHDTGYW